MDFESIKQTVSDAAAELGIGEYEIYYLSESEVSAEAMDGAISGVSSGFSGGVSVRVCHNGKMGYASTELIEAEELGELPKRARENAENTEKEDNVGLFCGSERYDEPRMTPCKPLFAEDLCKTALDLQDEISRAGSDIAKGTKSAAAGCELTVRIANSHGLSLETSCRTNYALASVVVSSGGELQSDFAVRDLSGDCELSEIAKEATDAARRKVGAGLVPSGKYDVVISGKEMRAILSAFSPVFSAKNAELGLSLLRGKVGERVASDAVTLTDDPMREGRTAGTPFDAEGVATYRKAVIERGILKTLLHNRETAKSAGVETTANASKASASSPIGISPYTFVIEAGEAPLSELLATAGDGIYVTEVKGLHAGADAVTGDFSIESAGFMIRGGRIAEPVKSFTIAGNFFELLRGIEAVSSELSLGISGGFRAFGSADVLVRGMSVAGK